MTLSYMIKRYGIPAGILVLAVVVFTLLSNMKTGQKRGKPTAFVRRVTTQTAAYGKINPFIKSSGRIKAWEQVSLTPEVTGLIVKDDFRLREGTAFAKSQVLFKVDDRQARYSLQSTISDLQNTLSGLLPELKVDIPEAYEAWQAFFNELSVDNIPEVPAYGSQREKLLANRYNVYKLYYTAKTQNLNLARHTVTAPFSGTVSQSEVHPSSMVRAGSPVATITRTDQMEIELALTPPEAQFVRPGMKAGITVDGTIEQVIGQVHRKSNVLDERMQTVPVFVLVKGAQTRSLNSGAYAEVELQGAPIKKAFILPRKAIHNKNRVYAIEEGRLAEKEVTIAYLGVDQAYITGGVAEGAALVAEPLQDAVIGMAVQTANGHKEPIPVPAKEKARAEKPEARAGS